MVTRRQHKIYDGIFILHGFFHVVESALLLSVVQFLFLVTIRTLCDVIPDIHSEPALSLRSTLRKFSRPRHHITNPRGKEKIRKFIKKIFKKSGLRVWSEYIDSVPSLRGENIVAMLKGKNSGTADDRIVVVGAHYDTTSRTKGVDDNGSGVTALLQVAKQIGTSGCRFENTILFVAFDFEEDTAESEHPIPFGSRWFVRNLTKHLHRTGGTVKGAMILEMLANHNTTRGSQHFPRVLSFVSPQAYHDIILDGNRGNFLAVIGRKKSDKVLLESLNKHYKNDQDFRIQLVPIPLSGRPSKSRKFKHLKQFYRSDHFNFWENSVSIPAVMVTDTSNFRATMERCYHRRCDGMKLIGRNDLEFLRRNINAIIKSTLELSKMDSCRTKPEQRLKASLLITSKTSANLEKSNSDDTKNIEQTTIYKQYKILPTSSNSQAISSTALLPTLLTCINFVFLLKT